MRQIIYYECEKCKKKSLNREEIMKCEASHYGLSIAEKQEWDKLKDDCRYAGITVNRTNNEETRKAFYDAIEKCMQFEKEHNIKCK